jgi:putative SOS response-associated peptidase YedK
MCGRYRLSAKERYIRDNFGLDDDPPWTPRWNIAPTQSVLTIQQDPKTPKRTVLHIPDEADHDSVVIAITIPGDSDHRS